MIKYSYNTRSKKSIIMKCCGVKCPGDDELGKLQQLDCSNCGHKYHGECLVKDYGYSIAALMINEKEWTCPDCDGSGTRKPRKRVKKNKVEILNDILNDTDATSGGDNTADDDSDISYKDIQSAASFDTILDCQWYSSDDGSTTTTTVSSIKSKKHKKNKSKVRSKKKKKSSSKHKKNKKKNDKKSSKKYLLKKKLIKNRLSALDKKHGLKYNDDMLNVSDSATDLEFDAATYYPSKPPASDKKLESLRHKEAHKHGVEYFGRGRGLKDYTPLEIESLLGFVEALADNPKKYGYNSQYGWTGTVSELGCTFLYAMRKKDPETFRSIPFRNTASIKSKFRTWEDGKNKEVDKDYNCRFIAAKNKLNAGAKKAASNAKESLQQLTMECMQDKVKNANKKIKKLSEQSGKNDEMAKEIKQTLSEVRGLIKSVQKEEKTEEVLDLTDEAKEKEHENVLSGYPEYDSHTITQHISRAETQQREPPKSPKTEKPSDRQSNLTGNISMGIKSIILFLTKMQNKECCFDEEAAQNKVVVSYIEKKLFDPAAQFAIITKFQSLKGYKISDEAKLYEMKNFVESAFGSI